jgi:SAM-dependent methyltransferase
MHLNSSLLFCKYAIPYFKNNNRVLEIGPAGNPSAYCKMVNNSSVKWDTIDFVDSSFIGGAVDHLTYRLEEPYRFPVPDNTYDVVVAGQVIEHVQDVFRWVKELRRIVKSNGLVVLINPVSWPFHEAPIDCWRIFPSGMEVIAQDAGLRIVKCHFESLEADHILKMDINAKLIPGRSYNYEDSAAVTQRRVRWNKFIRNFPFLRTFVVPIEISYDTISILQK